MNRILRDDERYNEDFVELTEDEFAIHVPLHSIIEINYLQGETTTVEFLGFSSRCSYNGMLEKMKERVGVNTSLIESCMCNLVTKCNGDLIVKYICGKPIKSQYICPRDKKTGNIYFKLVK